MAPCTLNAVFDNSSWAIPNPKFIIGRELGYAECHTDHLPNVVLEYNVLSPWSLLPFMPNGFNNDRQMIRSFPENHLDKMAQAGNNKTIYRFVHAKNDDIANAEHKLSLVNKMSERGFNVEIKVYSEKDIDGKYIKTVAHGMNLSMRTFFSTYFAQTRNQIQNDQIIDTDFEHDIEYRCETKTYTISFSNKTQPRCIVS